MKILLTNDDGIHAPGLRALRRELMGLGEVLVVAPASEQSAAGHSVTIFSPLLVQEGADENQGILGWAVEGRPADCVKLALRMILPWQPDLIVSGLNAGSNAGINVLYSGTVGAAIEGSFFKKTSIACSLEMPPSGRPDFAHGARHARTVIDRIIAQCSEVGSLFNINIPDLSQGEPTGVAVLPQNTASYTEWYDKRTDPRGRVYFWIGPDFTCHSPVPDSDVTGLAERLITVTPLQFNMTRHDQLETMKNWTWTESPSAID